MTSTNTNRRLCQRSWKWLPAYPVGHSIPYVWQAQGGAWGGLEQLPPTSGTAACLAKTQVRQRAVLWNRERTMFPVWERPQEMKAAINFGYQFPTHSLLMWTLVVQLWIIPVYNVNTGVADCFHQLENRLVALENLFEFLWITINSDRFICWHQLTEFAISTSPMMALATGLS